MFYNAHNFTIENSTFNDIAGSQHINTVTNTYHNAQIIELASSRTTAPTDPPILPSISLPTSEPFKSFIFLVIDIQRALFPIGSLISEPSLFKPLEDDLLMIIKSAAYLGRILELMSNSTYRKVFGSSTMREKFEMYTKPLQKVVDEIRRYQDGLRFTLIGPIWRRVLWSVMWTMSADADIGRIVNTLRSHLANCYDPGMMYLAKFRTNIWWSLVETLPDEIVSDIQSLRDSISRELPATNQVRLRTIAIDFGFRTLKVPLSSYATYKNLVTLLKYTTDHIMDNVDGFIDPSNNQVIGPSRFKDIMRSEKQDEEAVIVPVWSDVVDVFFEDKMDLCPFCGNLQQRAEGVWAQCDCLACRYMIVGPSQPMQSNITPRSIRLSSRDEAHHANGYCKVNYAGMGWSQLLCATSITNIQGYTRDILYILHQLHLAGSPVEEISIANFKRPNIVLPDPEVEAFELSDNGMIHLLHLHRLSINSVNSDILEKLSLPQLRYFKTTDGVAYRFDPWESTLTFMKRAPLLSEFEVEVQRLTSLRGTAQFLCDTISSILNLAEIHVHFLSKEESGSVNALLHDLAHRTRSHKTTGSLRSKALKMWRKKRMRTSKLELISIWFDWVDKSDIQVPEPWVLSTSDCGVVARLYVANL